MASGSCRCAETRPCQNVERQRNKKNGSLSTASGTSLCVASGSCRCAETRPCQHAMQQTKMNGSCGTASGMSLCVASESCQSAMYSSLPHNKTQRRHRRGGVGQVIASETHGSRPEEANATSSLLRQRLLGSATADGEARGSRRSGGPTSRRASGTGGRPALRRACQCNYDYKDAVTADAPRNWELWRLDVEGCHPPWSPSAQGPARGVKIKNKAAAGPAVGSERRWARERRRGGGGRK